MKSISEEVVDQTAVQRQTSRPQRDRMSYSDMQLAIVTPKHDHQGIKFAAFNSAPPILHKVVHLANNISCAMVNRSDMYLKWSTHWEAKIC